MFSKVLAFGLSALALVRAAPELTCSSHATSVGHFKSFGAVNPGLYKIYNAALGAELRSFALAEQLYVTLTSDWVGDYAVWDIQRHEGNAYEFTISNVGIKHQGIKNEVQATSQGALVTLPTHGDCFSIEPAGDGLFTVKVPNTDAVWSIADGVNGPGQAGVSILSLLFR
ncbi:hypothetical protein C8R45DRAFT_1212654 [Mycena sanguinolenta]|nr:hypothetical protein C8R45DRAFT_1212654 [Mycena sanguinolenta]